MKTRTLQLKVTDQERKLIEKCAKEQGTTASQFVRGMVVVSATLDSLTRKSLMQLAEVVEVLSVSEPTVKRKAATRRQSGAVDG
jgi:uncharacterized protein (DUF1778 family)